MGGRGSGQHMGPGRTPMEAVPAISIVDAYRDGRVQQGTYDVWFTWTPSGGETRRDHVGIEWDTTGIGTMRPLWLCPRCGWRVERIHLWTYSLGCRHCFRLCYQSQLYDKRGRAMARAHRLEARLEVDEQGNTVKPKWMRWKTFNGLMDGIVEAEVNSFPTWMLGMIDALPDAQASEDAPSMY
jgi:hypothetical protein